MLISIITINFNNKDGLEKTMKSVFCQLYHKIQYIIIDGASTDGSKELIENNKDKVSVWVSEKDAGIYDAMNKGIRIATGDYIYFLNSGDQIHPNTLNLVFQEGTYKNVDVIYGDIGIENSNIGIRGVDHHLIKFDMPFCHQAVLVRTELCKMFFFNTRYSFAADYDFFWKLYIGQYRFYNTRVCFGIYDTGGVSNQNYFKIMLEYTIIIWRNNKGSSKFQRVILYLWNKKKFVSYLIGRRLLGEKQYQRLIASIKGKRLTDMFL